MSLKGLSGKIAIVTGGGSGIGQATAVRLAAEGARVAVVDIDLEAAERVAAEIGPEHSLAVQADVTSESEVIDAFAGVRERFGRIDLLHNNAGIEGPLTPLAETDVAQFDRLFSVNLRGAYLALREMLRIAAEQQSAAAIVNTSSGTGLHAVPGLSLYGATKAGLISLTRSAALEVAGEGVRVNAIVPGPVDTPLLHRLGAEMVAEVTGMLPIGRLGQPEEIAALAAWLLSEESTFVTGGIYTVDGGETA